jgi:hypothetical protein
MTTEQDRGVAITGSVCLIFGAVAFMAVFAYLAARFGYPDVLDGSAADVLPRLLALGAQGRAVWAIYALLPLLFIPAGVATFHALRRTGEAAVRTGMLFAVVAALAMTLGLMRWPSFEWELARAYETASPDARVGLAAVFDATNSYLGNYIGEFLGELCLSVFFVLAASAMLRAGSGFPKWVGWMGLATGVAGLIGMFRNATKFVGPIAEVNNYLLPVWMIVFGVYRWKRRI